MAGQPPLSPSPTRPFSQPSANRRLLTAGLLLAILPFSMVIAQQTNPPAPASLATPPAATTSQPATRTAEEKKQDDINRVMEFFRVTQPDVYEQARSLRTSDPAKFEKLISGAISTVNHMEGIRRRNPKIFELCMQEMQFNYASLRMAHELKRTDLPDPDRKQITEQLKNIIAAEFDVQQQIKYLEIEDLQKKVSDLDNAVHARQQDKDNVLHKRLEDLTERTPRLEW
jgi:hypothetical protein